MHDAVSSPSYIQKISHTMDRWFPTPRFLLPFAAGIDISDASIKWMSLKESAKGFEIAAFGDKPLPSGVVVDGAIQDVEQLGTALASIKTELGGATAAHAALPEEAAYVFSMHVPAGSSRDQISQMVEFE